MVLSKCICHCHCLCLCLCHCLFLGQVMFSHHSEQISKVTGVWDLSVCSKIKSGWLTESVSHWQCHVLSCPQTVPGQLKASHFKCMFTGSSVRPARMRYCLTLTRWRGMDGGKPSKVLPSTRQTSVLVRGVQKYWTFGPSLQFVFMLVWIIWQYY